jgi:hypothetical protein
VEELEGREVTSRVWLALTMAAVGCTRANPEANFTVDAGMMTVERCGDGRCSPFAGETCASCPADCGGCLFCRPGFADCNNNPADGCEANVMTVDACGACGNTCHAVGGTNVCVQSGDTFQCRPTCDAMHVACGDPADGCDTVFTGDPNDAPSSCPGLVLPQVPEGGALSVNSQRILPTGDTDVFNVLLKEGTRTCNPLSVLKFNAKVTLTPPPGVAQILSVPSNINKCDGHWPTQGLAVCVDWMGTCAVDNSRTVYFQVSGPPSCVDYTVTIEFCNEGTLCAGC